MQISVLEYLERTAQAYPDRAAFCDENGAFTFSQLRRAARGVGSALAALPGGVMRKCGMRYEGTLRQFAWSNAGIGDMCWYGILAAEWQA